MQLSLPVFAAAARGVRSPRPAGVRLTTGKLVGARGFEPRTPCAQGRCATRLRYAPTVFDYSWDYNSCVRSDISDTPERWSALRSRAQSIILTEVMPSSRYALVTYLRNPIGEFVEHLRQELHPTTEHMAAHLTILPPRELTGSEAAAVEFLEEACSHVIPFRVELGDVETFLPTTATVFIQVKRAAYRMRELHDQLCGHGLNCTETWPYIPHLTILKTDRDAEARAAFAIARERWAQFSGRRDVLVEKLMFVRETNRHWQDVAPLPLGHGELSSKS